MTKNIYPPVWSNIYKHSLVPKTTHDERARFNFLACLNKHLSASVSPGNKIAFEKRVKPNYEDKHGKPLDNRDILREEMKNDPHYQSWSALRRSAMEMRQQAGRSIVLRQANSLSEKVRELSAKKSSTLVLDKNVRVPLYMYAVDNHLMPGSYHTELFEGDVTPAANYDAGLFVTTAGMLGRKNDGGGKAIAAWVKKSYPDFKPKKILDIGCGLGHNVLPIAETYPDATIYAIDTGVPMLRYGHARSVDLDIDNVVFMQMDAADLKFENDTFDWVQSTMFLHETAGESIYNIMKEIYRVLKPGGITLHIEQPQYTDDMDVYEQFIRDWDAFYNNEPFWSKMHDIDPKELIESAGFKAESYQQIGVKAVSDLDHGTRKDEPEDHGRAPVWNVFGAVK